MRAAVTDLAGGQTETAGGGESPPCPPLATGLSMTISELCCTSRTIVCVTIGRSAISIYSYKPYQLPPTGQQSHRPGSRLLTSNAWSP